LSQCLRNKIKQPDDYELTRISRIALRQRVPEAIQALVRTEGFNRAQLLREVRPSVTLPTVGREGGIVRASAHAEGKRLNP
jgi:hypothetical protein